LRTGSGKHNCLLNSLAATFVGVRPGVNIAIFTTLSTNSGYILRCIDIVFIFGFFIGFFVIVLHYRIVTHLSITIFKFFKFYLSIYVLSQGIWLAFSRKTCLVHQAPDYVSCLCLAFIVFHFAATLKKTYKRPSIHPNGLRSINQNKTAIIIIIICKSKKSLHILEISSLYFQFGFSFSKPLSLLHL